MRSMSAAPFCLHYVRWMFVSANVCLYNLHSQNLWAGHWWQHLCHTDCSQSCRCRKYKWVLKEEKLWSDMVSVVKLNGKKKKKPAPATIPLLKSLSLSGVFTEHCVETLSVHSNNFGNTADVANRLGGCISSSHTNTIKSGRPVLSETSKSLTLESYHTTIPSSTNTTTER